MAINRGNGPGGVVIDLPEMPKLPPGTFGIVGRIVPILIVVVLALQSYYQVAPFEQAVVLRLGRYIGVPKGPGPRFRIPLVDRVYKVPTERQLKEEFGFRTLQAGQRTTYDKEGHDQEALMLTGDLNIAEVEWVVQYRIIDPYKFLFALRDSRDTVRAVAEAEMRGAVGDMGFNEVIKTKRHEIEENVQRRMQEILEVYGAGIDIKLVQLQDVHPPDPVKDSFEEVNRALQEMERSINEALQERNKVLFRVEGEAKQRIAQAEGAKIERINEARGDAKRFDLLLAEYRKAPEVTRQRLYLESMEKALTKAEGIVVIDQGVEGMLPILDLARRGKAPAAGGGQ